MWKMRLTVASILVIPPVVGFVVGAYIGDVTCVPDEGFLGGLNCIDRAFNGGLLGFLVGLISGVGLVWGLRALHRE